jgi:hypothetical protein
MVFNIRMSNALNSPIEIDTAIAEQLYQVAQAERQVKRIENQTWIENWDEAYAEALENMDAAQAKQDELQSLYTGWTRYWHVTNKNGHIHTSRSCTSCFFDTQYFWRTDLSGLTPEEVVEREAYNACSVCMPIAPAEQRAARTAYTKAERERKAAEKAAAKLEKEIAKIPRQHALALKVNELFDAFGEHVYGEGGAYRATCPGERFGKGYGNAFHLYADIVRRRQSRSAR